MVYKTARIVARGTKSSDLAEAIMNEAGFPEGSKVVVIGRKYAALIHKDTLDDVGGDLLEALKNPSFVVDNVYRPPIRKEQARQPTNVYMTEFDERIDFSLIKKIEKQLKSSKLKK
jgi:hypothetical protein